MLIWGYCIDKYTCYSAERSGGRQGENSEFSVISKIYVCSETPIPSETNSVLQVRTSRSLVGELRCMFSVKLLRWLLRLMESHVKWSISPRFFPGIRKLYLRWIHFLYLNEELGFKTRCLLRYSRGKEFLKRVLFYIFYSVIPTRLPKVSAKWHYNKHSDLESLALLLFIPHKLSSHTEIGPIYLLVKSHKNWPSRCRN